MRSNLSPAEELFQEALNSQLPQGFEIFREASDQFQKSAISLGAIEAGILQMFVRLQNRPRWIEIGTLTGFSAFCLAKSLPEGGHLWTLEKNPEMGARARELLIKAGLSERVTVVLGDAMATLPGLESQGPFDGVFIDGNKAGYLGYLDWAEKNLAQGGLIIADNVFLGGDLFAPTTKESRWSAATVQRMKDFINRLLDPRHFEATLLPTSEGLLIARRCQGRFL